MKFLSPSKLSNELSAKKLRIVKLLYDTFLATSFLALSFYFYRTILNRDFLDDPVRVLTLAIIIIFIVTLSYLRFYVLKRDLRSSFIVITLLTFIAASAQLIIIGTEETSAYLLFIIMIFSINVVLGVRDALLYVLTAILIIITVLVLQNLGIIVYIPRTDYNDIFSTLMIIVLLIVLAYIAKISYDQIEDSYTRAFNYAKELERINIDLDAEVKLKTKELKSRLKSEAENLHSAAILGSITQPMLHDLSTPISTLKGTIKLLEAEKKSTETENIIELATEALGQLERIIINSKDLMSGKEIAHGFSVENLIKLSLFILKNRLNTNEIEVQTNLVKSIKIYGVTASFERIILNILINAIDALSEKNGQRTIKISSEVIENHYVLTIRDNGHGIKDNMLAKVFEPSFSTKINKDNFGLGLSTVKSLVTEKFLGKIEVKSKYGKYTEFILTFSVYKSDDKQKA